MKVSATVLFWIGCIITILSAVLQSIIPSFPSLPLIIVGVALSIWQWYRSAREQRQQFEQERKVREAAEQYVYNRTPEGKILSNLSQLKASMHMDIREPHS